jgi:hypothetical protein
VLNTGWSIKQINNAQNAHFLLVIGYIWSFNPIYSLPWPGALIRSSHSTSSALTRLQLVLALRHTSWIFHSRLQFTMYSTSLSSKLCMISSQFLLHFQMVLQSFRFLRPY